jgi:hypothetical protein
MRRVIGYRGEPPAAPVYQDLGPGSGSAANLSIAELITAWDRSGPWPQPKESNVNRYEADTFDGIKSLLRHSVENSVRMSRAADDARAEDYPLIDPEDLAAVPERARPALTAAAQRLRELTAGGDRIKADDQVRFEALTLVPSFPRTWRRAKLDPAALAQQITEAE